MAMFGNLLKRKKPTVDVPAGFGTDKSQFNRRMGTILARSTRHELKAPSLAPDVEAMTAPADLARNIEPAEAAANAGTMPVNAGAMAREAARQAEAETAPAMEMPVHEPAAASVESFPDGSMEALRAKLKASLSALRDGEPEREAAEVPVAVASAPAPAAPVAASLDEKAHLILAAPDAREDEPESVSAVAAPDVIMVPPLEAEPAPLDLPSEEDKLDTAEAGQNWAQDDAAGVSDEASVPVEVIGTNEPAVGNGHPVVGAASLAPVTAIYLTQESLSGSQPEAASDLVVQVVDYLMYDAGYYPEELPLNGVRAWCMDFFVKNVREGGFGTFVYNAHGQPEIWEACAAGMEAAGAVEHLDVFDALRNLLAHDAALAVALGDNALAGQDHPDLLALEEEFAALEARAPLARSAGLWLASLPEVEMVGEDELQSIVTGFAEHPDLDARRKQNA